MKPPPTTLAVAAFLSYGLGAITFGAGGWVHPPAEQSGATEPADHDAPRSENDGAAAELRARLARMTTANWDLVQENARLRAAQQRPALSPSPALRRNSNRDELPYESVADAIRHDDFDEAARLIAAHLERGPPGYEDLIENLSAVQRKDLRRPGLYEEQLVAPLFRLGFTHCEEILRFTHYLDGRPIEEEPGELRTFRRFMRSHEALVVALACNVDDDALWAAEIERWSPDQVGQSSFVRAMLSIPHPQSETSLVERFGELEPQVAAAVIKRLASREGGSAMDLIERLRTSTDDEEVLGVVDERLAAMSDR